MAHFFIYLETIVKETFINIINFIGNILTSQGPGTAFEFALSVAKELVGEEKVQEVKKGLLL